MHVERTVNCDRAGLVDVGRRVETHSPKQSSEGTPHRTLQTVVAWPVHGPEVVGPMPLVVFATGYGGNSMNWSGLTDHWVRAGYVVAAPTFPLSCKDAPGGTSGADLPSQPGDLAFVAREVLDRSAARLRDVRTRRPRSCRTHGQVIRQAITVLEAGYNPTEQVPTSARSWP